MTLTVAATQMRCSWDMEDNLNKAERLIREAAAQGAQVILPQENVGLHFFGFMDWKPEHFRLAQGLDGPIVRHMQTLARDLGVVIPVNFFEKANNAYFNTNAMIDADGAVLGVYRKTHIPGGPPGCFEKIYTSYGDTGFQVFQTAHGKVGAAICWDQWFPESARVMALKGADILLYPTAIGSDCHDHWETVMRGHAGANLTPLVAANRVGREAGELGETEFWGRSFIAGPKGEVRKKADDSSEMVIVESFDLEEIAQMRAGWGVFRDRRPDAYGPLLTMDGARPAL
ncbi:N-carbamoyl-D-amino acid hydrolase [Roseovarius sp. THAF8]|uniref:carbon-nitrogen hydrolase n=1 Tax=Roseovarius sp. THAF8 TaxID=2587846 RepID=UPI001267E2AD|nr:carbon-nitrogen hydrolase [Roseovarius sp. THAF8]QFT97180.1 N-carbamoyl-D-amino acid hydrolase [Roseovarius sp. THAF8]